MRLSKLFLYFVCSGIIVTTLDNLGTKRKHSAFPLSRSLIFTYRGYLDAKLINYTFNMVTHIIFISHIRSHSFKLHFEVKIIRGPTDTTT